MIWSRGIRHLTAMLVATTALVIGIGDGIADASTGIRTPFWSGSGMTLSQTSYKYSNASAFWQTLANSNGECIPVDGIFGPVTAAATINIQNGFGVPATDVVNAGTRNALQFWVASYEEPDHILIYRHQNFGYIDGFGTQYWSYYGGGPIEALMGWNPIVPQWFLNPYPASSGSINWTLIAASASRTIGSYPCNG
ncbi:MAG: hypothetical protein FD127_2606 [Acidimicrobiaceae bacterium]|nr:MAG: hypothetical protein FD127_2606 [Acidimicrobiaceae bacterium]